MVLVTEFACGYKAKLPERRVTRSKSREEKCEEVKKLKKTNLESISPIIDTEIKKITSMVKDMKVQQKNFGTKMNSIEETLNSKKKLLDFNKTDDHKIFEMMKILTLILVSMMYDKDKKIIGFEKLLRLFEAYRFGLDEVQHELRRQGCRPTLKVIYCVEKLMESPVEENLREFLATYKKCCDKGNVYRIIGVLKFVFGIIKRFGFVGMLGFVIVVAGFYSWYF